jgi:hypothetical protein
MKAARNEQEKVQLKKLARLDRTLTPGNSAYFRPLNFPDRVLSYARCLLCLDDIVANRVADQFAH